MTCNAMIFNKLSNYTTPTRPYVSPREWCVYHLFVLISISVHLPLTEIWRSNFGEV
jgi:hypothetical protein